MVFFIKSVDREVCHFDDLPCSSLIFFNFDFLFENNILF